jgi:hypothetical protein
MKYLGMLIVWALNLAMISFLAFQTISTNNDKSPVVFIFGYVIIFSINLISWGILSLLRATFAQQMEKVVLFLSVLFVPILIYSLAQ